MKIFEFLALFYWPLLPLVILKSFQNANWTKAYRKNGFLGIVTEGAGAMFGLNEYIFYASLHGGWGGRDIERLLSKYGIEMWGWGFAYNEMFFHVREEQASVAQQVLLSAGVELLG